jgi:DNA-binding MarR family transcriptional regulator
MNSERFKGLAGFRHGLRRFLAASERISREGGVTPQQYQALLAIKAAQCSLAMKDLAEELLVSHHAAVQLMDRLETAGLAKRSHSTARDRRLVFVALTLEGDQLITALAERHLDAMLSQAPQLRSSLNRLQRLSD